MNNSTPIKIHKLKERLPEVSVASAARFARTLSLSKLPKIRFSNPSFSFSNPLLVRFSAKEQTLFAKRMSFLIKAGVPIVECLLLIRTQTKSKGKAKVFDAVIADVTSGQHLSTSLGKFSRLFGDFAVNLIRVGEQSGILAQNLVYLADELQKKQALQRKVIGALVYPVFITVATIGVTAMLTAYIFPKLMPIFTSLHVELPLTTRAMIAASAYIRDWGLLTLLGLIVFGILFHLARVQSEGFRKFTDRLVLHVPFAGSIVRAYNLTNFCRTLGLLLRSGIKFTNAIEVTAQSTKNRVYRETCTQLSALVTRGEPISKGLAARPDLYPDILTHMVAVGERTGSLSTTLTYLGEMYESEVDELTKTLSSSIEPVLMIVMGLLVGTIAVSVITPIYDITQHLNPKG
jgi:type II secretory pathway component PulF